MVGQGLEIQNSDPLLHNIKAIAKANRPFNVSQPSAGMKRRARSRHLSDGESRMQRARLDARLRGVRPDPFFAVSKQETAALRSPGLPPGTYHDRGLAREVRHADGDRDDRGHRNQPANFTFAAH